MLSVVGATKKWLNQTKSNEKLHYRSLFIFNKTNKFRKFVHAVSSSWLFEYFILVAIISSCGVVTSHGSAERYDLDDPYVIVDVLLNTIFGLEIFMKVIAYGFILHRGAYMRNSWNVFDFTVVISG